MGSNMHGVSPYLWECDYHRSSLYIQFHDIVWVIRHLKLHLLSFTTYNEPWNSADTRSILYHVHQTRRRGCCTADDPHEGGISCNVIYLPGYFQCSDHCKRQRLQNSTSAPLQHLTSTTPNVYFRLPARRGHRTSASTYRTQHCWPGMTASELRSRHPLLEYAFSSSYAKWDPNSSPSRPSNSGVASAQLRQKESDKIL